MYRLILFFCFFLSVSCSDTDDSGNLLKNRVLEGAVSVALPSDFTRLTPRDIRRKFSAYSFPEEAWGDMDKNVWISFRRIARPDTDSLDDITEKERLKFIIFEPVVTRITVNGKEARRVAMTIPGQDGTEMKTIIQFQYHDKKLIVSEYSVSLEYVDQYEPTGLTILNSVHPG